jgi:hypothetical protein
MRRRPFGRGSNGDGSGSEGHQLIKEEMHIALNKIQWLTDALSISPDGVDRRCSGVELERQENFGMK